MESRIEIALDKHRHGYNCAQAIICTYCDLFGMDEEAAFKVSEGFGGGMGGMQNTCGAVTAMFMLAGLKNSVGSIDMGNSKASTYALVRKLSDEFREMNSTTICKELKGANGEPVKRSCPGCIEDAAKIVENFLIGEK